VISSPRSRAARTLALALGLLPALAAGPAAGASPEAWRISIRGQDVTRTADPRLEGGVLTVGAVALGPSLPLLARATGRSLQVRDSTGIEWQGRAGETLLVAADRSLPLDRPIRIDGPSAYLPAAAVAELAGLALALDPDARTAAFLDRATPAPIAPSGWEALVVPKPAAPGGAAAPAPRLRQDVFLPPDHDTLRVNVGLGAVPGADGGGDLTATGSVRGIDTALSLIATTGPRGFELQNSHAALTDPVRGLGLEAGDLFSGIWGLTQGARFRWRRGDGDGASWPALSIYTADPYSANPRTVATYSDEIGIGPWSSVGGELASDGSWLADGRWRHDRYSLFGYARNASGPYGGGRNAGLSGSAGLFWGMDLQGSYSQGDSEGQRLGERILSLRIPLHTGSDLTLATDRSEIGPTRSRIDSADATTAFGHLLLRGRLQMRETAFEGPFTGPFAGSVRFAERDLLASASYFASSRLRLEVQILEQRPEQGAPSQWRQISAALALFQHTSLQVFATSSSTGFGNTFRIRLDQEIRPGFSLFVEAGNVVTFQSTTGPPDRSRLRIMVRRTWDVATPSAGTAVRGVVASSGALPTAGLPVELGPYRTVTDDEGHYKFPNVPAGDYDLRLREQGMPADMQAGPPSRVRVKRGESQQADLSVEPLSEAHGWVYVDRNGNHRRDPGEGIAGAAVVLDDRATSTAPDGSFGFYNLPPGAHKISIVADRLPAGLRAQVPTHMDFGLPAGQSIDGLMFLLAEISKPIIFQETRK
jgi:hypothetical protein